MRSLASQRYRTTHASVDSFDARKQKPTRLLYADQRSGSSLASSLCKLTTLSHQLYSVAIAAKKLRGRALSVFFSFQIVTYEQ